MQTTGQGNEVNNGISGHPASFGWLEAMGNKEGSALALPGGQGQVLCPTFLQEGAKVTPVPYTCRGILRGPDHTGKQGFELALVFTLGWFCLLLC